MTNRQSKRARREAARRARQRQQRIRWGTAAVIILAVTGIIVLSGGSGDQAGALAPDFELETPDGETVRLSDYRGKPVAVTFMHTY